MHAEAGGTVPSLIGGGEMGQLIRDIDWSATPLGDYATWPQSLRSSLSMVLNTAGIAALYWGPEQWLLYNDAYGVALGDRHPHAFGKPMPEVLTDIGPVLGPQVADVLATGRGFAIENLSMVMRRFGRDEETTWTYGFSPVQGEDGGFAGVLLLATEVTAQKKAERELQASQARLQAMMDQAAAGIAQTTLDGQFTFVNDRFCAMLGRSREELLSLRMHDLTHPDDLPHNAAHFRHLAEGGPPFDVEKRYLCKDGSAVWVHNSVTGVREANDEVQSLLAVSIDITKQVQAETELRARESQLRQVADALPVLVAFINRDLTYEFANAAYRDWFGIEPEDTVGKSVAEVVGTQGYAERRSAIERALSGEPVRFDIDWPWSDGRRRIADIRYTPRRNDQGTVDGFYVFVQDVTAVRDATALLSAQANDLTREIAERTADRNALWDLSSDLMLRCTFDGRITAVNPAWTALLDWHEDELLGSNLFDLIHPDDMAHTVEGARELSEGFGHASFENRYRHRDESYRWISWSTKSAENLINAVGRDITVERERAQALADTAEALRQAQKMEAVGQLTGGLAHDFNNLLTGMMGNLELLQLRVARGRLDDLDRFINAAQGAGRRAASLTERLLAFSRRQTLDPKPTDVNRLIAGLEDMLHRTVGATVGIEVVGAAGLWTADIDAGQLENAILNLCINGRDAMPEGGKLTIETANKWIDDRTGRERELAPGQYISICVTDTGTGMTPDTIARAFEPFYTTKPIGQGTGLGLSMIYGFAKQSGGQVRIYSEVGQGTTVCIYLPRHHGEVGGVSSTDVTSLTESASAQTVLVVDDEATIRHLIDEVLDDLGYTVIGAADGAAGLKVLQSGARIELLITDVGLPNGMNGRQVADAARALRPGLKVLFITGFAENAAVGNGHLEPGMELLTKPFTLEALSMKVADMLK